MVAVRDRASQTAGAGGELALKERRDLARGLHPAFFPRSRPASGRRVARGASPVLVEIEDVPEEWLPEPVEGTVDYLIAEALTNVARYAQASTVRIAIAATDGNSSST